ncbi:hypothetical protein [Acidisphaera sp. S103]|uniref:hypothetical protein n=1 Tax=Acidisphaera sp. S103 TaxID=1747223 RepID=UPI001C2060A7|nr:hypothetical protein [Acidisphaera sp. S103]
MEGDANGAPHLEPAAAYAGKCAGKYEHRLIKGGVGHNQPQEAPHDFAQAVIDVGAAWSPDPRCEESPMQSRRPLLPQLLAAGALAAGCLPAVRGAGIHWHRWLAHTAAPLTLADLRGKVVLVNF